jgi:DNA invertase Pin-like site-specific DNA recombinase
VPETSADSELMARIMSLDFSTGAAGIGGTVPRIGATEQPIDTGTAAGKCFLDMLGVFAEFETNLRRERQLEGIATAKAAGIYKCRPASIDAAQVREMKAQGLGATEIAKALGIGRASVYRVLEASHQF